MKKQTVIEALNSFDDEFEIEKLIERLFFVEKIEKGIQQSDEGKVLHYEVAKQKFLSKYKN